MTGSLGVFLQALGPQQLPRAGLVASLSLATVVTRIRMVLMPDWVTSKLVAQQFFLARSLVHCLMLSLVVAQKVQA